MTYCVFITGASGSIGRYLLIELLQKNIPVIALLQPSSSKKRQELLNFLSKHGVSARRQLRFVYGDITKKNLGLTLGTKKELCLRVTHMIHAAADTRFSISLSRARQINVNGTKHCLELAASCTQLLIFGFLSTIYVSGKRQGTIKEEDLLNQGFVNAYEQSKFEAEKLIHDCTSRIPTAIYRLSTIIGDSQTGYIPRLNSVHQALRLYHSGLAPMIAGTPTNYADFLSTDYAAKIVILLFLQKFQRPKTYHIISGSQNSFMLAELLNETERHFMLLDPEWSKKRIEQPAIVSDGTFTLFDQSVKEAGDIVMTKIIKMMQYFIPHLTYLTYFSTENTDKELQGRSSPPHVRDYYGKVIKYCIDSNWGQNTYDKKTI